MYDVTTEGMRDTAWSGDHQHSFPFNPPGGSFLSPGPCGCGKTYDQNNADARLAEALAVVAAAYGVAPRISTHWAVAFGSKKLNDGIGCVEYYDDEGDAREHLESYGDGRVVKRTVIALRWEAVPDQSREEPGDGH
jgi:hypothetical protein